MPSYDEQIKSLEDELKKTKYNKRTQHHIGLVKAKIARLKERQAGRSKSSPSEGFAVKKSGNATVALLGFPSVGKSTLLNALTDADSKTASYAFTTVTVVPGMMEYKHARIQILDLPGIIRGASKGSGRGREVISVLRQADLVLIVLEPGNTEEQLDALRREVYDSGIRLDENVPDVKLTKNAKGGITIYRTVRTGIDNKTIESVLREFRIPNATIILRQDISVDQLIDVIESNKVYTKSLVIVNKIDMLSLPEAEKLIGRVGASLGISASTGHNIGVLKDHIFDSLAFIRIYLKEVGKKPDMDIPLVLSGKVSVRSVCNSLHRDFEDKFRFAKVWGKSAKFDGQKVNIDHLLSDNDVLEITLV
ncbi:MAG: OBG GTPase family GTP-binding protein [Candidatus Woesearchaeota archaeon]